MLQCKKISNTCSECMFYSPWISSVIWSSVSCPAPQHFPTSYGHVCPVQQYSTFPRFMVICVLSSCTTIFHVIWSSVSCPPLQQFSTLYGHLCPVQLYNNFPRYFIKVMILEGKNLNIKLCFDFIYKFCPKHFSIYDQKCKLFFMQSSRYSCAIKNTCTFSTEFRNILKYQIPRKSAQWQPSRSMLTDGYTCRS
jgi:hypothetical protein